MFELDWIDDLAPDQVADELAGARDLELVAQASKMLLAARWADVQAGRSCTRSLWGRSGSPAWPWASS